MNEITKTGFNDTIAYGVMASIFSVAIFFSGMYVERNRSKSKGTTIVCDSSKVLNDESWKVDLTKPLFDQDCTEHESFNGKILCQRLVTIECDKP